MVMTMTDAQSEQPKGLTRLTVNLTPKAAQALEQAVVVTGDSKTDTVNRALQAYAYIVNITQNGGDLYIRDGGQAELQRLTLI